MQSPGFAPAGAQCAIHTDRSAQYTCARCGNFMCNECGLGGANAQCPRCLELAGATSFPFSREDYDFSRVWDFSFDLWKREWLMLSVGALIFFGASMVGGMVSQIAQSAAGLAGRKDTTGIIAAALVGNLCAQAFNVVVQGAVQLGYFRMVIDVLHGRKADVGRMFTQLNKLPRYLLQVLIIAGIVVVPAVLYLGALFGIGAAVSGVSLSGGPERIFRHMFDSPAPIFVFTGGMLLLLPVIIYVSLGLQLAAMELVYGDCGPWEAIKRSWSLANGHRFPIFGYGFVGALVVLVGLFACCVGVLPAFGLQQLLILSLFLALRSGSGLPPPPEP